MGDSDTGQPEVQGGTGGSTPGPVVGYAVISELTIVLGEEGADRALYFFADTKLEALVQMGRHALWRAAWMIPDEDYIKLFKALSRAILAQDLTKGFNVAGVTYYVEETTKDALVKLNRILLPKQD